MQMFGLKRIAEKIADLEAWATESERRLKNIERKNEALEGHLERMQIEWRATKEKMQTMVAEIHKTSSV